MKDSGPISRFRTHKIVDMRIKTYYWASSVDLVNNWVEFFKLEKKQFSYCVVISFSVWQEGFYIQHLYCSQE
jgi:hypothetical protein